MQSNFVFAGPAEGPSSKRIKPVAENFFTTCADPLDAEKTKRKKIFFPNLDKLFFQKLDL